MNNAKEKIFIIAGNYAQANIWARERCLAPSDYIYVSNVDYIKGHWNKKYALVGTFKDRDDYEAIMSEIIVREFKEINL